MYWFAERGRRNALLLAAPMMAFVFALFNTTGLTQSTEPAENSGDSKDYEEVFFSALDTNYPDIVYIDWSALKAAHESSCAEWFLGAYRSVSEYGSNGVSAVAQRAMADKSESLCVDLERGILTNSLYYAVNCSVGDNPALYLNLRDTNGNVLVESGNLLAITNAIWYADGTNAILLFDVPTAEYLSAAVVQLACHSRASGNPVMDSDNDSAIVHESLLFINDGSGLWLSEGQGNVATNYSNNSLSNFYDWVKENSPTNKPGGGGGGGGDEPGDDDNDQARKGIIYVDQAIGNDEFSGRLAHVAANKKGPKKTVGAGLAIAGTNETLVIRSGNYRENLDIRGKDVKVVIEGKVKL